LIDILTIYCKILNGSWLKDLMWSCIMHLSLLGYDQRVRIQILEILLSFFRRV
jgi:hypothetical protein